MTYISITAFILWTASLSTTQLSEAYLSGKIPTLCLKNLQIRLREKQMPKANCRDPEYF